MPDSVTLAAFVAEPPRAHPGLADDLDLYWLPPVERWAERIREVEAAPDAGAAWSAMVALANTRLDFVRTLRLDRALQRRFGETPPPGLATRPVRLAVLASSTAGQLLPATRVAALRRGLWVSAYEAPYGQYLSELLDTGSGLYAFEPNTVLFAMDAHHLTRGADPAADAEQGDSVLAETLGELARCWRIAREAFRGQVIQQSVLPIFPALLGENEHRLPGSPAALAARLNAALRGAAANAGVDLLAVDVKAAQTGIARWHDPVLWHRAKQEISPLATPLYGELFARLAAAQQGRTSKCLVLDLDNTLWGGVIGDDGLDGIVIGQGSALGEAFLGFQAYARALAKRGVILAVCSKNDEANALAAFRHHPDMVLRENDIACFVANWNDKAANVRAIAARLNIGLDALVFVDDNPFERNLIRQELPMVAVPEVPEDPALFAAAISDGGYFEGLAVTEEDRERTGQYRANLQRETLQAQSTDLESYLRGLQMELVWRRFDLVGLQRIVQLINKTNQFNLTTQRYTQDEVLAVMDDPRAFGLQLRLLDRFGDNGIIGIVIGRRTEPEQVLIDTWLMSCRVLGRRVEEATLALVAAEARRLGAARLIGEYRPTAKNGMVRDHYRRLGFDMGAAAADGSASGVLVLADLPEPDLPMVIREG
jgi:FkbH-like protein